MVEVNFFGVFITVFLSFILGILNGMAISQYFSDLNNEKQNKETK